jgi:hypothetical protein
MRKAIDIDSDLLDNEGLCYDSDRAQHEGLYEELILKTADGDGNEYPIAVTEELFEALSRALDLGVNIEPGVKQGFPMFLEYVYDYGKTEQLV